MRIVFINSSKTYQEFGKWRIFLVDFEITEIQEFGKLRIFLVDFEVAEIMLPKHGPHYSREQGKECRAQWLSLGFSWSGFRGPQFRGEKRQTVSM